jgi:serine/threonine protein kinase
MSDIRRSAAHATPAGEPARTVQTPVLALLDEQTRRWRAGEEVAVEDYLARSPGLRSDTEALLDLIYNEVRLREERGETPGPEEYRQRFPELEDMLRVQFEVHQAMRPGQVLGELSWPGEEADFVESKQACLPVIDGYEVLEELGRGAMGVVYKARHLRLNRLVALKMILAGVHAAAKDLARFEAEARAVARLRHPNIVQIHEIGEQDGRPYLCLELLEGGSLAQQLRGRALPAEAAARLVEALARAVQHAHEQGVVHRDLKPANVLLSGSGVALAPRGSGGALAPRERSTPGADATRLTPKITDFGLARLLDGATSESGPLTAGPVGTPPYMAPEQAAGNARGVDRSIDVYALGAILYEALTGRPPFLAATVYETLEQVRSLDPVPPRRLQPKVPRDLETICLACLRKEPHRRYASAAALADDLRRFTGGEPIAARPTPAWERAWKWCRRKPAHAALVALVVLLAAAGLAAAVIQERREARRVAEVGEQVEGVMEEGREALRREDVDAAREKFQEAWVAVQGEPGLRHLQTGVVGWLLHGERAAHLRGWKQRIPPRDYDDRRDEALLHSLLLGPRGAGEVGPARQAIRTALALTLANDPAWGRERELLALVDADLVLLEGAAAQALRRIGQDNDNPTRLTHERRAGLLERLSRKGEAERERLLAAKLPPEGARGLFLDALERLRRRDLAGALRALEGVLDAEPEHFTARLVQAACLLEQERPAEARVALTACIAQRPGFAWSYLLRGRAHVQGGDSARAARDFRRALERLPEQERPAFWRDRVLTVPGVGALRDRAEFKALGRLMEAIRPAVNRGVAEEDL